MMRRGRGDMSDVGDVRNESQEQSAVDIEGGGEFFVRVGK